MDYINTIVLGVLQGATEFLPISSSAHLVIGQALLKLENPGLLVEIILHLGTLVSVLVYFRGSVWKLARGTFLPGRVGAAVRKEVGYLIVATLPAVVVALTLDDYVEAAFDDVRLAGWMLLVTTTVLVSSRWTGGGGGRVNWRIALLIGLAQACAILPGISRSGITIVAGLWLGLKGEDAARFSFLMAIPAILGAGLLHLTDLVQESAAALPWLFVGFLTAGLVGYVVIAWLMGILRRGRLHYFAAYTLPVGLMVIFWLA